MLTSHCGLFVLLAMVFGDFVAQLVWHAMKKQAEKAEKAAASGKAAPPAASQVSCGCFVVVCGLWWPCFLPQSVVLRFVFVFLLLFRAVLFVLIDVHGCYVAGFCCILGCTSRTRQSGAFVCCAIILAVVVRNCVC